MSDQKPKPCPFCGGTEIVFRDGMPADYYCVWQCYDCGATGGDAYKEACGVATEENKSFALMLWNRRACKSCGNIAAGWYEYDPGKAVE